MYVDLMRDKSTTFPDVGIPYDEVTSLRIWHCKYKTLQPIARFQRLRALRIATFPDDSLELLTELRELEWLSIVHLPKIASLAPLGGMKALRWLELQTLPSWDASRKRTRVVSLAPLVELPCLEHLSLLGVVAEDQSLRNLKTLGALKTAQLHGFPKDEIAGFFAESSVQRAHIPDHELQTR